MNKVISILSGGLDSTILTYKLVKEYGHNNVIALTFNYGQRHNIEVEKSKITCKKLNIYQKIIDISFLGDIISNVSSLSINTKVDMPTIKEVLGDPQPVTYVPYRNMILITLGMSLAESVGAREVYSGLQVHDEYSYWDTSSNFIEAMNNVSRLNRKSNILLRAPFANLSKADEIILGQELNVPFEDTWTCYTGSDSNEVACGTCPSCSERIANFYKVGVADPLKYNVKLPWD